MATRLYFPDKVLVSLPIGTIDALRGVAIARSTTSAEIIRTAVMREIRESAVIIPTKKGAKK